MEKAAVFLDLDGTLLNSQKEISPATLETLSLAAEQGAYIIPATGRFYLGIPEIIRNLPFARYFVNINGAEIYDAREKRVLHREEMPMAQALKIFSLLDGYACIYDCYAENWGYMERGFYACLSEYIPEISHRKVALSMRTPVDGFRKTVAERFETVQKVQAFFRDMEARKRCIRELTEALPECRITASLQSNVEINSRKADKGEALLFLRAYLGIPPQRVIAFGDNSNDVTMLRGAGVGVAMGNATPEAMAAADMVTASNDADGVAAALRELLLL